MFSYLIAFAVINKYGKGGVIQISTVFAPLRYCLSKSPLKLEFLDIYFATCFGPVTSEIHHLSGASIF